MLNKFSHFVSITISKAVHYLEFENPFPYRNIDKILNNSADKKVINKATERLENNRQLKYIVVKLSCGNKIKIKI